MRYLLAFFAMIFAQPSAAHIGHLGELAGHGHWLGAAALAAAIALAAALGLRNQEPGDKDEAQAEDA